MTENEANKILYTMRLAAGLDDFEKPGGVPVPLTKEELADACKLAIKALGEVQQYREIGTVEECRTAVESLKRDSYKEAADDMNPFEPPRVVKLSSAIEIVKGGGVNAD